MHQHWSLEKEWLKEFAKLVQALPRWQSSLRPQCSMEEVRRRVQDGDEALTRTSINKYIPNI
jgi:hypothetical protein